MSFQPFFCQLTKYILRQNEGFPTWQNEVIISCVLKQKLPKSVVIVFITTIFITLAEIANVQAIPSSPPPTTVILLTVLFSRFAQFFEFMSQEHLKRKSRLSWI